MGGVNLDCVFTSAGESGMVESFPVRSAGGSKETQTLQSDQYQRNADRLKEAPTRRLPISIQKMLTSGLFIWMFLQHPHSAGTPFVNATRR